MMNNTRKGILIFAFCIFALSILNAEAHEFQLAPRLPNGLTLEPAGQTVDVGNMPLSAIIAPDGNIVLLLSGFREQGVQVLNPESGKIIQTIAQPAAFCQSEKTQDRSRLK